MIIYPKIFLAAALVFSAPTMAQDYLGNHLDTMREHNLRLHQQQRPRTQQRTPSTRTETPRGKRQAMSRGAEARARAEGNRLMNSHKPRLQREHRQRVQRDGKAAADRWLQQEAFRLGEQIGRQMRAKYAGQ